MWAKGQDHPLPLTLNTDLLHARCGRDGPSEGPREAVNGQANISELDNQKRHDARLRRMAKRGKRRRMTDGERKHGRINNKGRGSAKH